MHKVVTLKVYFTDIHVWVMMDGYIYMLRAAVAFGQRRIYEVSICVGYTYYLRVLPTSRKKSPFRISQVVVRQSVSARQQPLPSQSVTGNLNPRFALYSICLLSLVVAW